jgi:hypothetical protein
MLLPRVFGYAFDSLGAFATNAVFIGIFVVLTAIVASLEVIALWLSYRELAAAPVPRPTPPRARPQPPAARRAPRPRCCPW